MKSLPPKPSLEFLKKEAKTLRSLHRQGDSLCCERIRNCDTSLKAISNDEILTARFSINDAQRIIAREYGYTSWAALKRFVQSLASPAYHRVKEKRGYHQTIVNSYDARSKTYDRSVWHRELAKQTVDYFPPKPGDAVLDIATGTGTIAFYAAELVGKNGSVIGIDISQGMLKVCQEKLKTMSLNNLQFIYADAEDLNFPPRSFDRIYCSSAFFWMSHPLAALRHWFELLKPKGVVGFNAWPDDSFVWGDGARRALRKHGIEFTCHEATGNVDKTRKLVELAGFNSIEIHKVQDGCYISVEEAKGPPLTLEAYSPGQYPHPLANVSEETLMQVQQAFEAEVDQRATEKGVWHDKTMYYVYGQKP